MKRLVTKRSFPISQTKEINFPTDHFDPPLLTEAIYQGIGLVKLGKVSIYEGHKVTDEDGFHGLEMIRDYYDHYGRLYRRVIDPPAVKIRFG